MTEEEQRINDIEMAQGHYDFLREMEADDNAAREAFVVGLLHDAALIEDERYGAEAGAAVYAELSDEGYIPGIGAPGDDMPD